MVHETTITLRQRIGLGVATCRAAVRGVWDACCGLTPREREGVMLVAALGILGLVVQSLRALLEN